MSSNIFVKSIKSNKCQEYTRINDLREMDGAISDLCFNYSVCMKRIYWREQE